MPSKKNRIRTVRTRSDIGQRFKTTRVEEKRALSGFSPLSDLPEFDPGLPSKRSRVLFDEDAGVLQNLLDDLNLRATSVSGTDLAGKSDEDIAKTANSENRILITFNHNDFYLENRKIQINDKKCPGIIAIKGGNHAPGKAVAAAQIVEQILIQIGQCVPVSWWSQTKLSVNGERIYLKKMLNGKLYKFVIEADSKGLLWAKKIG